MTLSAGTALSRRSTCLSLRSFRPLRKNVFCPPLGIIAHGAAVATITTRTKRLTASSGVKPSTTAVQPSAGVAVATAEHPTGAVKKRWLGWTPEEIEKLVAIFRDYPACTDAMLEETFPNRTVSAVRVKIRTLWARGLAVKISTVVPWTEEELQTFMNHPSGFHDASDEELLCAFPGRTMPAISRKLGTWRRSLKATPSDWEHWTEQDYETFLEHPRFFSKTPLEETKKAFPNHSEAALKLRLRRWRQELLDAAHANPENQPPPSAKALEAFKSTPAEKLTVAFRLSRLEGLPRRTKKPKPEEVAPEEAQDASTLILLQIWPGLLPNKPKTPGLVRAGRRL